MGENSVNEKQLKHFLVSEKGAEIDNCRYLLVQARTPEEALALYVYEDAAGADFAKYVRDWFCEHFYNEADEDSGPVETPAVVFESRVREFFGTWDAWADLFLRLHRTDSSETFPQAMLDFVCLNSGMVRDYVVVEMAEPFSRTDVDDERRLKNIEESIFAKAALKERDSPIRYKLNVLAIRGRYGT